MAVESACSIEVGMAARHATAAQIGNVDSALTQSSSALDTGVPQHLSDEFEATKVKLAQVYADLELLKARSRRSSSSASPSVRGNTHCEGNTDSVVTDPSMQALSLACGDFDRQFLRTWLANAGSAKIAEDAMKRLFQQCQYPASSMLPQIEFVSPGSDAIRDGMGGQLINLTAQNNMVGKRSQLHVPMVDPDLGSGSNKRHYARGFDCALGAHVLGTHVQSCSLCCDHVQYLLKCSTAGDCFGQESSFRMNVTKFVLGYGLFTSGGIAFCKEFISSALADLPRSSLHSMDRNYLQRFLAVLDADASFLYDIVPPPAYIVPSAAQVVAQVDPNANYVVSEIAFDFGYFTVRVCLAIFRAWVMRIVHQSDTPRVVAEFLDDSYFYSHMMPFAKMVVYSFYEFTQEHHAKFTIAAIENAFDRHYRSELTLMKWGGEFAKWLSSHVRLMSVFHGEGPFVAKNLKALANVGAQLLDTMFAFFATVYQIGEFNRIRHQAASNESLREMYDSLIQFHNIPNKNKSLSRNWNNKGNSIESLAMFLFEENRHALLWYTGFICFHSSYRGTALPNIRTV
jgi:hypothetical protein